MEHLRRFGIEASHYHNSYFEPLPKTAALLFRGNEELVPKDRTMYSMGSFTCSVPHTVLLKRGQGSYYGQPALATLGHEKGRVTVAMVGPRYKSDYWLITVLLSWVARGCPA